MNHPSDPASEDNLPSDEEFDAWMRAHPENAEYFVELMARAEKGDFGEVPAEMRDMVRLVLEKHAAAQQVRTVQRLLQDFFVEVRRVHEGEATPEALRELNTHCDSVVDAALDLPEPHRGEFLKELLPLRDNLRQIGEEPV